ncbi:MAG: YfhO family protein [Hungatella sp.]|nr:YfhO family protein [Hungatella sp.]
MKKDKITEFIILYTGIFALLFTGCFCWFFLYNKTIFWSIDGLSQHYTIFVYIGKWLRTIFLNIFVNHSFVIPMWDMGIGYGSDIMTSLGAYIFDPFNWLSALTPPQYSEYMYSFTIILRFYLSGLAFSCYAFYKKNGWQSVLTGAIIYTFCASAYIAFYSSDFLNPMYIFPLLILGVDKIWNNEKPYLYILVLAWSFLNYFYFAYMMCIFIFIYDVIYWLLIYPSKKTFNSLIRWVIKFFLYSLLGCGIAMVAIMPILSVLMGVDRLNLSYYTPLMYDSFYFKGLWTGWITSFWMGCSWMGGRDCLLGFGAIALPCVIFMLLNKNEKRSIKLIFLVLTGFLCFPCFGIIFNGFSYAANRWIWAYCLCVAYIVTITVPKLYYVTKKWWFMVYGILLLYVWIAIAVYKCVSLDLEFAILIVFLFIGFIGLARKFKMGTYYFIINGFACLSVLSSAYFQFNGHHKNATYDMVRKGEAYNQVMNGGALPLLKTLNANTSMRYDEIWMNRNRNASWLYGISGMDFYISLYNGKIDEYHNNLALLTSPWPMGYSGLNRRTELEILNGVQYFFIPKDHTEQLPYGYNSLCLEQTIDGQEYQAFTSPNVRSLVYPYYKAISQEDYQLLTPYERQQALMQACVLDTHHFPQGKSDIHDIEIEDDEFSYQIELSSGIAIDDNKIYVENSGAQIKLRFEPFDNSEIYLFFEDLDYKEMSIDYSLNVSSFFGGMPVNGIGEGLYALTNKSHIYGGKHNWLLNLGFTYQPVDEIVITFEKAGNYTLSEMKLYRKPESYLIDIINKQEIACNDVQVFGNEINSHIILDSDGYVYAAVPYSKGWEVFVNGKRQEILKANDAFMAIALPAGEYDVRFKYCTPYLIPGLFITCVSLCMLYGLCLLKNVKTEK